MASNRPTGKLNQFRILALGLAVWGMFSVPTVMGIQPNKWLHTTEADFEAGEAENTVVTNLGDIKLAKGTETIGEMPEDAGIVFDVQKLDGEMYLAAGPEAMLLKRAGDEIEQVLSVEAAQIFSLDMFNGKLLVAVSGTPSRLAVLSDEGALVDLVTLEGVRYVWDMLVVDQSVFVATGIEGELKKVDFTKTDEAGKPTVTTVLDTAQSNILCLSTDGQGRIYAGTDTDGLIFRVTMKVDGEPSVFVLYDAPEPEIGALLVMADGTVYAGTADAEQARPGRLEEAAEAEVGRPEKGEGEVEGEPGDVPGKQPQPEPLDGDAQPGEGDGQVEGAEVKPPADDAGQAVEINENEEAETATVQEAGEPAEVAPTEPSAEQRDQLREIIRDRLAKARKTGAMQSGGPGTMPAAGQGKQPRPSRRPKAAAQAEKEGNAIYRIDPTGFVTEVFRESVMILRIVEDREGKLLVATGNEGQIFKVDPAAEETSILADLESEQIPVVVADDDELLIATASPATLTRLNKGYAVEGIYTSSVLDASQISLWGALQVIATTPVDTSVLVETRSGNVEDPEMAAWSDWQQAGVLSGDDQDALPLTPRYGKVDSPPARFLQYRLTLEGTEDVSPVVDRVQLAYVMPNLKPQIASIVASYGEEQEGPKQPQAVSNEEQPKLLQTLSIEWEATDANEDPLLYTLEYQAAGMDVWLPLADELTETSFEWQTMRVPDGRYVIRVTASDSPANTPDMAKTAIRRSDPVVIDNTAPQFSGQPEIKVDKGSAEVTFTVYDALLPVTAVHWALDSTKLWQPTVPEDMIYDSTRETVCIKMAGLSPGSHVLTLRASDAQGNALYRSMVIEIP